MSLVHPQNITYSLEMLRSIDIEEIFDQMEILVVNPCRVTDISDLEVFDHELEQKCDLFIQLTAGLQAYLAASRGTLLVGD